MAIRTINKRYRIEDPNCCPRCHHAIAPTYITERVLDSALTDVIYECSNCVHSFIAMYRGSTLENLSPKEYVKHKFENEIKYISPSFVEIYNQSLEAESKT